MLFTHHAHCLPDADAARKRTWGPEVGHTEDLRGARISAGFSARRRSPACSASSIMCSTGGWWRGARTAPRARPGFSDPDGLDDPSAEAEEAEETEEVEEEVSLEVTLPGAILQAERYRRPPQLASLFHFLKSKIKLTKFSKPGFNSM